MAAIKIYDLTRLKKFGLLEYAENFMKISGECPTVTNKMQRKYGTLVAAYDTMLSISQRVDKSDLTDPIHLLDAQQDGLYTAIWHAANSLRKSEGETGQKATSLWNTINSKKVHTKIQYLQELAEVDLLIAVLDRDQAQNIEDLGLKPIYEQLKAINAEMHRLVDDRSDELLDKPDGKFSVARANFTVAYDNFVNFVNAYQLVNVEDSGTPDEALDLFIRKANNKIKLYEDTQRPTTSSAGTTEEVEEEVTEEVEGEETTTPGGGNGEPTNPNEPSNPGNGGTNTPGGGSENTVTVVFEFHGGRAETVTGVPGTAMTKPANTTGYMWPASVPSVFPAENATYTEVEDNRQEYQITYMDVNNEDEFDIQMVKEGDPITPPTPPTGYHWVDVPEVMPARNIYIRCAANA